MGWCQSDTKKFDQFNYYPQVHEAFQILTDPVALRVCFVTPTAEYFSDAFAQNYESRSLEVARSRPSLKRTDSQRSSFESAQTQSSVTQNLRSSRPKESRPSRYTSPSYETSSSPEVRGAQLPVYPEVIRPQIEQQSRPQSTASIQTFRSSHKLESHKSLTSLHLQDRDLVLLPSARGDMSSPDSVRSDPASPHGTHRTPPSPRLHFHDLHSLHSQRGGSPSLHSPRQDLISAYPQLSDPVQHLPLRQELEHIARRASVGSIRSASTRGSSQSPIQDEEYHSKEKEPEHDEHNRRTNSKSLLRSPTSRAKRQPNGHQTTLPPYEELVESILRALWDASPDWKERKRIVDQAS